MFTKLQPRRDVSHCDRSSRRNLVLLPWDLFRKTKEDALHNSAISLQWKHLCDNCSRLDFVGPSTVGEQWHLRQFQKQHQPNFWATKVTQQKNAHLDGISDYFELFEDLIETSVKIQKHLTEENASIYFHSLINGDALQTFKNNCRPPRGNLGKILVIFRKKYAKAQSMATAKHTFHKGVSGPSK